MEDVFENTFSVILTALEYSSSKGFNLFNNAAIILKVGLGLET